MIIIKISNIDNIYFSNREIILRFEIIINNFRIYFNSGRCLNFRKFYLLKSTHVQLEFIYLQYTTFMGLTKSILINNFINAKQQFLKFINYYYNFNLDKINIHYRYIIYKFYIKKNKTYNCNNDINKYFYIKKFNTMNLYKIAGLAL